MGKQWKHLEILFSWAPKSLQMVAAAMKLKAPCSLEENYDQPRQHIKKQSHYFTNKFCLVMAMVFPVVMVLEMTLESPLDCKEIQPVHPKGNPS